MLGLDLPSLGGPFRSERVETVIVSTASVPAARPSPAAPRAASDDPLVPTRVPAAPGFAAPRAAPLRVTIPHLGVEAEVVDVGLEPDGAMEVPEDVRTVGWYVPPSGNAVLPGADGTAVIAGHVDSRTQGPGAFIRLRTLEPGHEVSVDHADGTRSLWQVTEVQRYPKDDVPLGDIFVWAGEPRLALITCGGEFDRSIGSYLDNYVVYAVRIG